MNTRALITLVLAVVAIVLVMLVTGYLTVAGGAAAVKFQAQGGWSQPFAAAQAMKIIDAADKQKVVVLQNANTVTLLDANGKALATKSYRSPVVSTFNDLTGDGAEEILVFYPDANGVGISVLTAKGEELRKLSAARLASPARAYFVRFAGGAQIVVGDERGQIVSLTPDGKELWRATLLHGGGDAMRGMDEVKVDGVVYLAAANHDGQVALYDAAGKPRWTYYMGEPLRRLRAYELSGGGKGQILLGGDTSKLAMLDAATGKELLSRNMGQTLTEIREVETDGNPASREFVVGGKDGGVWAFAADGKELWSQSLGDAKITEIAGVDVDDDGADEVIVGDDAGNVTLFAGRSGSRTGLLSLGSEIARIDAGKLTGSDQFVTADQKSATLYSLELERAPVWYTPLTAGVLISLVIVVAAWFVATMPQKVAEKVTIADQSAEGLQARLRMLHEDIADVDRLRRSGEMEPQSYLARLRELRGELSETEAVLIKAGVKIKPETMKCPNCGGALPLGLDKCEYCGAVVIG